MTPNPHPASGNGDVIERLTTEAKWLRDNLPVRFPNIDLSEIAELMERAAGLLKLSEGSGDGKMREVLLIARRYVAAEHDRLWSRAAKAQVKPDLRKIDAALDGPVVCSPAPSPIDAEGMRLPWHIEAHRTDKDRCHIVDADNINVLTSIRRDIATYILSAIGNRAREKQ